MGREEWIAKTGVRPGEQGEWPQCQVAPGRLLVPPTERGGQERGGRNWWGDREPTKREPWRRCSGRENCPFTYRRVGRPTLGQGDRSGRTVLALLHRKDSTKGAQLFRDRKADLLGCRPSALTKRGAVLEARVSQLLNWEKGFLKSKGFWESNVWEF